MSRAVAVPVPAEPLPRSFLSRKLFIADSKTVLIRGLLWQELRRVRLGCLQNILPFCNPRRNPSVVFLELEKPTEKEVNSSGIESNPAPKSLSRDFSRRQQYIVIAPIFRH